MLHVQVNTQLLEGETVGFQCLQQLDEAILLVDDEYTGPGTLYLFIPFLAPWKVGVLPLKPFPFSHSLPVIFIPLPSFSPIQPLPLLSLTCLMFI